MKKIVITILALLFLPNMVFAVNEVTFDADTNIEVGGVTLVIKNGAVADQVVVNANNIEITLSSGSSVTITSSDRRILENTLSVSSSCAEGDYSTITLPAQSTVTVVTVTPLSTTCAVSGSSVTTTSSSGGGGGVAAPSKPTTETGKVTATVSGGGKTTLTTDENTSAIVDLPANAVSASTEISITNQSKSIITKSRPVPSGKQIIGSYVYDYTAVSGGGTVSTFDKDITISITYTDEQISGLEKTNLKIVYWRESDSQWVTLSTLVYADTNILTATTDHFTYFAILANIPGEVAEEITEEGEITIVDGDLIRNPNIEGMAQFDIYIVKMINGKKFKRLILSPHVFESYEHFDKNGNGSPWDDVLDVSQSIMDEYTTSELVRAVGDSKVYKLVASGDTGTKQWVNMTATQFVSQGYDSNSIYEINTTDRNAYTTGADVTVSGSTTSDTIIIKISTLRVRSLPSLNGEILTEVSEGEVYDLLDEQDGWYKITANSVTGWCYGGDTGGYAAKQ
ncbi:SH3 domain-containing protein [Patescibacteria group bacterium]|nr:SH3 domain-containing protein [Patescibacteria group bacterium]